MYVLPLQLSTRQMDQIYEIYQDICNKAAKHSQVFLIQGQSIFNIIVCLLTQLSQIAAVLAAPLLGL